MCDFQACEDCESVCDSSQGCTTPAEACSDCSQCSDCGNCSQCSDCGDCSQCSDCGDCSQCPYGCDISDCSACQFSCMACLGNPCQSSCQSCLGQSTTLATPSSPSIVGHSEGGLTLTWTTPTGATSYTFWYALEGQSTGIFVETSSSSVTLTGLLFGQRYQFQVKAFGAGYNPSDWSSISLGHTRPKTPTLTMVSSTSTSITLSYSGMSGNFTYVRVYRYNSSNVQIDYKDIPNTSSTTSWTGLPLGQVFYYDAQSYYSFPNLWSYSYSNRIAPTARPDTFDWDYGKASGENFILTADEWKKFRTRVNDFRRYCGLADATWTYTDAQIATGADFTSSMFNEVRNALYAINGRFTHDNSAYPFPSTVSPLTPVYARYLNNMVRAMNSIF